VKVHHPQAHRHIRSPPPPFAVLHRWIQDQATDGPSRAPTRGVGEETHKRTVAVCTLAVFADALPSIAHITTTATTAASAAAVPPPLLRPPPWRGVWRRPSVASVTAGIGTTPPPRAAAGSGRMGRSRRRCYSVLPALESITVPLPHFPRSPPDALGRSLPPPLLRPLFPLYRPLPAPLLLPSPSRLVCPPRPRSPRPPLSTRHSFLIPLSIGSTSHDGHAAVSLPPRRCIAVSTPDSRATPDCNTTSTTPERHPRAPARSHPRAPLP